MKQRGQFTLVIIAAVILLAVLVPYSRQVLSRGFSYIFSPVLRAVANYSIETRGFFYGVKEISDLKDRNRDLSDKLSKMQIDQTELSELRYENEILKKQLGFMETHKNRELIPAKIIGRDPIGFLDNILIDKGGRDGISVNMPVITDGALVGKITEVHDGSAKVTLITSKDSLVQGMVQSTRDQGILRGGLSGIVLDNIPQDSVVATDDMVITSGLGGDIEQGIMIGTISREASGSSEIFKTLEIQPIVDFSRLELVFILK